MPNAHAACGGSSVSRWLRCPGSVQLLAPLPRTSSAAADRGTMLHAAMERVMDGTDPGELARQGFTHNGVKLEQADARKALVPARHAHQLFLKGVSYKMEVRVKHAPRVWGTADLIGVAGVIGYVGDYKFGTGAVAVADNEQLQFYASAALACGALPPTVTKIKTAIIQPESREVLQTHTYSSFALHAFGMRVRDAAKVALSKTKPAPLVPGDIQCKWCDGKKLNLCPALNKHVPGDLAANLKNLALRA